MFNFVQSWTFKTEAQKYRCKVEPGVDIIQVGGADSESDIKSFVGTLLNIFLNVFEYFFTFELKALQALSVYSFFTTIHSGVLTGPSLTYLKERWKCSSPFKAPVRTKNWTKLVFFGTRYIAHDFRMKLTFWIPLQCRIRDSNTPDHSFRTHSYILLLTNGSNILWVRHSDGSFGLSV